MSKHYFKKTMNSLVKMNGRIIAIIPELINREYNFHYGNTFENVH